MNRIVHRSVAHPFSQGLLRRCNRIASQMLLTPLLALGLATSVTAAPTPAGTVVLVTGQASASSVGTLEMRALEKGDPVYPGEIISSGANTYVNLKFSDGSFTLLRPGTRFAIESFVDTAPLPATGTNAAADSAPSSPAVVAERPAGSQAFFRLLKGGFRAVSGLIGKSDPAEYRIDTPVATIGIRGTDYWVVYCDPLCAQDPVLHDTLPVGSSGLNGVVVGVIQGGIFVVNSAGQRVDVDAGQYLITLPDGTQTFLPYEPRFLRVDPIPNPTTLCEES